MEKSKMDKYICPISKNPEKICEIIEF